MQPSGLPQSTNVEDRTQSVLRPDESVAYLMGLLFGHDFGPQGNEASPYPAGPTGPLSHAAGIDSISPDYWTLPISQLPKPRP